MIDSCKMSLIESQISDDYCSLDEPTYANETQWFIFNSTVSTSSANTIGDEEDNDEDDDSNYSGFYSKIVKPCNKNSSRNSEQDLDEAAIKIQRCYRKYRRRSNSIKMSNKNFKERYRKLNPSTDKYVCEDENYIEFLDESTNRSSNFSLHTADSVDQGFESLGNVDSNIDLAVDKEDDYSTEHIYDSIPYDTLPSPTPPGSPVKEHTFKPNPKLPSKLVPANQNEPTEHLSGCPYSKMRKYSDDVSSSKQQIIHQTHSANRLIYQRKSEYSTPQSVMISEGDLTKQLNLCVIKNSHIPINNPSCPTHNVIHNGMVRQVPYSVINNLSHKPQYYQIHHQPQPQQQHQQHQQHQHTGHSQHVMLTDNKCVILAHPDVTLKNYPNLSQQHSPQYNYHHQYHHQKQLQPNQQRQESKERQVLKKTIIVKRLYRVGLNLFNDNPVMGIDYLVRRQFINSHPSSIAKFLLTKNGISRSAVGEYLGMINDPLAVQVTKYLMRRINMKKKDVDEALRSVIYYVQLPGESQKILHIMEEFKESYISQNGLKNIFRDQETIIVLSYAIIMLHTDAFNKSIKKADKMTLEQFIHNLRGIDNECDIDSTRLENIYDRITTKEMKAMPDHSDQVLKLNDIIIGPNKPADLVKRTRRFMCYCRLNELPDENKKIKTDAHQREVFLFSDLLLITKLQSKSKKDDNCYICKYSFMLSDLQVKQFKNIYTPYGIRIEKKDTGEVLINLAARCQEDQKKFFFDLVDCIFETLETIDFGQRKRSGGSGSGSGGGSGGGSNHLHHEQCVGTPAIRQKSSPKTASCGGSASSQSSMSARSSELSVDDSVGGGSNNSVGLHRGNSYSGTPNPPRRQESLVRNEYSEPANLVANIHVRKPPEPTVQFRLNCTTKGGRNL